MIFLLPLIFLNGICFSHFRNKDLVKISLTEKGVFLFRFNSEDSCLNALERLWHPKNKSLILRRWSPGMELEAFSTEEFHKWARLRNVPTELWNIEGLGFVASGVDTPLLTDRWTLDQDRLGFSKVFVNVNLSSPPPRTVKVKRPSGELCVMEVQYLIQPLKCQLCGKVGHETEVCRFKIVVAEKAKGASIKGM